MPRGGGEARARMRHGAACWSPVAQCCRLPVVRGERPGELVSCVTPRGFRYTNRLDRFPELREL